MVFDNMQSFNGRSNIHPDHPALFIQYSDMGIKPPKHPKIHGRYLRWGCLPGQKDFL